MSWLFGRSSEAESRSPEITHSHKQRNKQIELLREQVPGVVELKRDEHYRVTLNTHITLDILIPSLTDFVRKSRTLPSRFPIVGPVVTVLPPVRHPWVNEQMVVDGSPLIKNFSAHSNLGRAVNQVIKEFIEHPPEVMAAMPQPFVPQPSSPAGSFAASLPASGFVPYLHSSVPTTRGAESVDRGRRRSAPPPPASGRRKSYHCPPIPETFADIKSLSTEELERYLSEEEGPLLVDKQVSKLDVIKKVQMDRDNLFQDNEDQASINLSHEPEIQEGWTQLQEKFLELSALKDDHGKMLNQQKELIQRYQRKSVISKLKTLAQESETESEVLAEEFLDGKVQVTEFIQKHRQQRTLHHLRKAKFEKLTYDKN